MPIGYLVEQKSKIQEVAVEKLTKINRVFLKPSNCKVAPGVVEAIQKADCIVIGPGSLYTNVIPNLLVNGVVKAIKESTAIKVYVSNIMTELGQTDDYSVSDHLNAIIDHCGNDIIDYCIYDTGEVIPEFVKRYNKEGQDLVEQDIEKIKGIKFLQRDLSMVANTHVRHDPKSVAASIIELICDDLKYQDKQNDPQYLMLNTKLREEKRINKIKKSMKKKEKKKIGKRVKTEKGKSKFSNKYSDRIKSIRESKGKGKEESIEAFLKKEDPIVKKKIEIDSKETKEEPIKVNLEKNTINTIINGGGSDLEQARANLEQVLAAAKADLERNLKMVNANRENLEERKDNAQK
ncbi:MAG: hypothetical protein HFJ35_07010 [Clostridia bacterium]|nr:hypothetical protein [Clostridia bacterium]